MMAASHAASNGSVPVGGSCAALSGPTVTVADEPMGTPLLVAATTHEYVAASSTPDRVRGEPRPVARATVTVGATHVAV